MTDIIYKTCDICGFSTNTSIDIVLFGDWMHKKEITVHYFCLLLSTNIAQKGKDNRGILGFLLIDIRAEIRNTKDRICHYCEKPRASIACHKCRKYFHLVCGHRFECLYQFIGEFRSYCHACVPLDKHQLKAKKSKLANTPCFMCRDSTGKYNPVTWIHANCCNRGYVHRLCMSQYALIAGYGLLCIWCRSKDFRDHVRLHGVFVPDRDALWELEKDAYASLHRGHNRCDMDTCLCPKGRDYSSPNWSFIVCSLCGSFGAHNPNCIPMQSKPKTKLYTFKCSTCRNIDKSVLNSTELPTQPSPDINRSMHLNLHMTKVPRSNMDDTPIQETLQFSEDETSSSNSTAPTVLMNFDNEISGTHANSTQNQILQTFDESKTSTSKAEQTTQMPASVESEIVDGIVDLQLTGTASLEPNVAVPNIIEIEHWPEFDGWNCIGSCTVRINLNSPRFFGKTIEDICSNPQASHIKECEKINRCTDRGVFDKIDKIIAEFDEE